MPPFAFILMVLVIAFTPGPNMIYLISRSICQGRNAGLISLCGIAAGYIFYMLSTALGITALFFAMPFTYTILQIVGTIYLLYLAWQALKLNGNSPFEVRSLQPARLYKLFFSGFFINFLNPKVAILYLSILPQFIKPNHGSVFIQSVKLGCWQIIIGTFINGLVVVSAGSIAIFFTKNPKYLLLQRGIMGVALIFLAVHLYFTHVTGSL